MTWHRGGRTYKLRSSRAWDEMNAPPQGLDDPGWTPKCKPADCRHGLSRGVQAPTGAWSYWCEDCGAELPPPPPPTYWTEDE